MISFNVYRTPGGSPSPSPTTASVIAALASFFMPGLGQLIQGRLGAAVVLFLGTTVGYFLWFLIVPGVFALILHLVAILDAATYSPQRDGQRSTDEEQHRMRFAEP